MNSKIQGRILHHLKMHCIIIFLTIYITATETADPPTERK